MANESQNELISIAKKLLVGASFRTSSFIIVRLIQIARIMIFARIFSPSDIGLANLAIGCIAFISILANFGFPQSVIREKVNRPSFLNTVFSLSLVCGLIVFILTWFAAPIFTSLFSQFLNPYIRLLSILTLTVPLRFPIYLWEKELKFGNPAVAAIISEAVSFIFAIILEEFFQLGVLSLLIGNVSSFLLSGLYVWVFTKFKPGINIDSGQLKPLFAYGAPLIIQGLNGEVMARGDNLMVGAYYGTSQLAFYNFSWQLPNLISSFTQTIDSMLLPVFAKLHEDKGSTIRLFNLANKMWSITGSFFGVAMLLFADQIVMVLYGSDWKPVVPILQVMSLSFIFRYCSGYAYDNLVLVTGRTKYMMKWGLVNSILVLTLGQFMIQKMGPIGGAWFWMVQALVMIPLIRFPLIHQELGTLSFIGHVWQPFITGLVTGVVTYTLIHFLSQTSILKVGITIISVLAYLVFYCLSLFILDKQLRVDIRNIFNLLAKRNI